MTKEEAKAKLRKVESDLRMANIVLEMHEQGVQEIKDEIERLQEIINKPDRWQDSLVQPDKERYFYLTNSSMKGLRAACEARTRRKPEHAFRTEEQVELIKEKVLLMQEMHAFSHVRNEGWMPDWQDEEQIKHGIAQRGDDEIEVDWITYVNAFVFGIAVESREIAEEMLEIFGERIKKFYNKQY